MPPTRIIRKRGPYKPADERKQGYYFRLAPDLRERMRAFKAAYRVPEAKQIDAALRAYLDRMEPLHAKWAANTRRRAARQARRIGDKGQTDE